MEGQIHQCGRRESQFLAVAWPKKMHRFPWDFGVGNSQNDFTRTPLKAVAYSYNMIQRYTILNRYIYIYLYIIYTHIFKYIHVLRGTISEEPFMDFPMETSEASPTKITSESHGTSVIFFAVFFWVAPGWFSSVNRVRRFRGDFVVEKHGQQRLSGVPGPILHESWVSQISKPRFTSRWGGAALAVQHNQSPLDFWCKWNNQSFMTCRFLIFSAA